MSTPPTGPGDTLHSFSVSSPADELEDRGGLSALYAQARDGLAARTACGARGKITYHSTTFFGFVNAYAETTCSDLRCAAARTGSPLGQLPSPQQEFNTFAGSFADAAKRAIETEYAHLTPEQRQADAAALRALEQAAWPDWYDTE